MRFTRIGYYYLLLTLAIFVAGLRREMNLLWLISGVMAGPLVFNVLLPRWILRTLTVRRDFPEAAFPGEKIFYTLTLETRSIFRFCGIFLDANPNSKTFRLESAQEHSPEPGRWRRILRYSAKYPRRGELELPNLTVKDDYPFGLFVASKTFALKDRIVIMPKLADLPSDWESPAGDQAEDAEAAQSVRAATFGDFNGLRVWNSGDMLRQIHWRASARHQQLLVQKFETPPESLFFLVADFTDDKPKRFERSVSLVAAFVHELDRGRAQIPELRQHFLSLEILGKNTVCVTSEQPDFYFRAMRELAVVEMRDPAATVDLQAKWQQLKEAHPHGNFLFFSTAQVRQLRGGS